MISVVVPIYNEEEILPQLHDAVVNAMTEVDESWEVVYVNDGSSDMSLDLLRALQQGDPHVVVVELSRNWGHMGALWAGMQTARGDAVVLMDGDLQDPPEIIPEMVAAWHNGAQVVTTVRRSRQEHRKLLSVLFPLFYRVLGALSDFPIPLNSGIFGLLDRQALDSINSLQEANRYLPGLRAWVGYPTAIVYYDRQDRVGGEGKLTFLSRIKYAMDAITSFSYKPLRVSFVLASFLFLASLIVAAANLFSATGSWGYDAIAAIFLTGGLLLFCLGVLGEYVGRVYDEVRGRPLSIINRVHEYNRSYAGQLLSTAGKVDRENGSVQRIYPAA